MVELLDSFFVKLGDFLITIGVFVFLALWIYCTKTKKTLKDVYTEIKESMEGEK